MSLFTFGIGTAIGAGVGYVAALFLAPGTGKENKKELEEKGKELYRQAQEQGEQWVQQASETVSQVQNQVKDQLNSSDQSASVVHASRQADQADGDEIVVKVDSHGKQVDIKHYQ